MQPGKAWTARGEREWRDWKRPWLPLCSTRMLFRCLLLYWYRKMCHDWSSQLYVHNYHFIYPQGMFDYLDNAVIKLCDMPAVGTDLSTVKQQIEELKVWIRPYLLLSQKTHWEKDWPFLFLHDSNIKWKFTSSRLTWRSFATKESCYSEKWATKQTETWFKSLSLSYATYGTTWWTKSQSDRWGNTDQFIISVCLLHLRSNYL